MTNPEGKPTLEDQNTLRDLASTWGMDAINAGAEKILDIITDFDTLAELHRIARVAVPAPANLVENALRETNPATSLQTANAATVTMIFANKNLGRQG